MKKLFLLMLVIVFALGSFIWAVNRFLPLSDSLQKADAIIAISGGDTSGRTQHAISLYQQGYAPQLIFSGAARDPLSASNARVMMASAVAAGVPRSDIALDEAARDTKENASSSLVLARDYETIILVTSPYHQRRAYREFKKVYGDAVQIINSPAEDKYWRPLNWWWSAYGWWISLSEVVKLALPV